MGSVLTTISRFLTRGTSAAAHTDITPKKPIPTGPLHRGAGLLWPTDR